MFVCFSSSQLCTVLLQQLKTELAEYLQEGYMRELLLSLLWVPKRETYPVPESKTHNKKIHL